MQSARSEGWSRVSSGFEPLPSVRDCTSCRFRCKHPLTLDPPPSITGADMERRSRQDRVTLPPLSSLTASIDLGYRRDQPPVHEPNAALRSRPSDPRGRIDDGLGQEGRSICATPSSRVPPCERGPDDSPQISHLPIVPTRVYRLALSHLLPVVRRRPLQYRRGPQKHPCAPSQNPTDHVPTLHRNRPIVQNSREDPLSPTQPKWIVSSKASCTCKTSIVVSVCVSEALHRRPSFTVPAPLKLLNEKLLDELDTMAYFSRDELNRSQSISGSPPTDLPVETPEMWVRAEKAV